MLFIVILTWDAILAFRFNGRLRDRRRARIVMWINVVFLAGYTFSLPLLPAPVRRRVDVFSKAPVPLRALARDHPAQRAATRVRLAVALQRGR